MADDDAKKDEKEETEEPKEESKEEAPKEEAPKEEPKEEAHEEKPEEEPKKEASVELSKDAKKILDLVEKLSVLDLAGLVKGMEEKFGVSAAAPVAVAAGGAAPAGGDAGEGDEGGNVTVVLAVVGDQKIPVIKAVREATGLGLKEAKDIVDAAPKAIKENIPREEADKLKESLEAVGATVEYK